MWKEVAGYNGKYEVHPAGLIRSLFFFNRNGAKMDRNVPLEMTPQDVGGYFMIRLYDGNSWKSFLLHRLIATAFVPNPENKDTVNHKNGIKHDCRAENLEWMTRSENTLHAFRIGLKEAAKGSDHGNALLTESKVEEIKRRLGSGEYQRIIAEDYGVSRGTIRDIKIGKSWRHVTIK